MIKIAASDFAALTEDDACSGCGTDDKLGFRFSYAFQPIVDVQARSIYAHEALVRGPSGESAWSVLQQVNDVNRYRFDQACRVKAIKTASLLNMQTRLSINFMPNAIYRPEVCIRTTLEAARAHGFPIERIIFETVEGERIENSRWLSEVLKAYKKLGLLTAIDDFGAGFAGLNLLADFQPDIVKLDMELIRGIDASRPRQTIVSHIVRMCDELNIEVIAEGVETVDEFACLRDQGLRLMQGYLFGRPMFEAQAAASAIVWH